MAWAFNKLVTTMALAFGTCDGNVLWCIDGNGEVMAPGTFGSDGFW